MENYFKKICIITLAFVLCSCKSAINQTIESIPINFNKVETIDLSKGKTIELETTDESLLYGITHIIFLKEKLFIQTRDRVVVFDKNGKFLFNISRKGNGPGEYTNIASVFTKNGCFYLYDSMSKKVICFDENGKYISTENMAADARYPVQDIYPLANGEFVAKNMFRGEQEQTPAGSILDDKYITKEVITGKNITSGLTVHDNFFNYKDEILYWEMLVDTIFSIKDNKYLTPRYFVDFEKHAIPQSERINKDIYELLNYSNKPENIDNIASFIGYINEDDRYLRFRFVYKHLIHYVWYDKQNKTPSVYQFEDKSHNLESQNFVIYNNGQLYLSAMSTKDMEKNPCLIVFDKNIFLKNITPE